MDEEENKNLDLSNKLETDINPITNNIESASKASKSNLNETNLVEPIDLDTALLKPPSLFKSIRRRSKTYSGEEFSAHLERISQLASSEHKSQDDLSELPNITQIHKNNINFNNKNKITPSLSNRSVSLQDQLLKRTNFSRKNYGSFELLFTLDREGIIQNIGKFRIENGDTRECLNTSNTIHLENPESQTRWYFKYFLGRVHQNYCIEDKNKNIYFLSVVLTDANDRHIPQYKAILWTKSGSQKLVLAYQHNKQITIKQILNHFQLEADKFKEVLDPDIQKELLVLEEQEGSINFKFGVVYAKHGQLTDDEMLSNENGSQEFEKFINLIGDKIRLKGWKRYRGGLDTNSDTTGEYSVYTIYEGHEIMFHVSSLLPYIKDSKQQLERKRHIGNDIVTIVFQDLDDNNEPDFTPSSARSQFQHIFALVTYNKKENSYRLKIYSEQSVPPFGPSLPTPPVFMNHKEFREFLLVKLINGEKSAFNNSVFGKRKKRTIEAILSSLYSNYEKENSKSKVSSGTIGIGEVLGEAITNSNKRKEELRKAEFLRIGQNLKLQTIIKGDAPTSQLTTGALKKELWEPKIFLQSFEHSIICSDSWNNCLVVGTNNGVYVIDEAIPWEIKQIFDKTVQLRQIDICDMYGLMIFCDFKGRLCVFRLSEFSQIMSDSSLDESKIKSKTHCKENRLEFINGCHLYAISKQLINKSENFKIVAACNKKIYLISYKRHITNSSNNNNICNNCTTITSGFSNLTLANQAPNYSNSSQNLQNTNNNNNINFDSNLTNDVTKCFQTIKEINCSDVPNLINLVDSFSGENFILIAFKNKFELISEKTGECLKQFQFNQLSNIRSIVELYDNNQLEILVTYNYTSEFIKLDEANQTSSQISNSNSNTNRKSNYQFQWNSEPAFVLCVFPYVIGFSNQCIEIRLLVNGNLVNSLTMSNLKLIASKKDVFFAADHENLLSNELLLSDRNTFILNVSNVTTGINSNEKNASGSDDNSPPSSPTQGFNFNQAYQTNSFLFSNKQQQQQNQQTKPPCSIYKISLDFLNQSNLKNNEKFNQLCENSTRTIQREISNHSSQFIFTDKQDMPKQYSIYQKIISSNIKNEDENENEIQISSQTNKNEDSKSG